MSTDTNDQVLIELVWNYGEMTVEEFSKLTLNDQLQRMPIWRLVNSSSDMEMKIQMPRLYLADGTSLSVQASEHVYAKPRDNKGPYTEVEVGFPTFDPPESWKEFFDGDWEVDDHKDSTYGYVPLYLVQLTIGAHGGVDLEKSFGNFKFEPR